MVDRRFHVHPLFWLMMLFSLLAGQFLQVITLFIIVMIHEAGHVAAAVYYGWRVKRIELLPFGGVAEVDEWGNTSPVEEVVTALAGPLMNGLLILAGKLLETWGIWSSEWTAFFVYSNVLIGGFNLLPIWPLDGGRVMQTAYSLLLPYRTAITASIYTSGVGALLLVAWSVAQPAVHFNGLAVACYLFFSNIMAYRQSHYQFMRFLLFRYGQVDELDGKLPHRSVRISPSLSLLELTKKIKRNYYHTFLVEAASSSPPETLSEKHLLYSYFDKKRPHCTVEQLLR